MIRELQSGDLPKLVTLLEELRLKSLYRKVKPFYSTVLQKIAYLQATSNGFVRVAEHDGELTGIMVCACEEFWWVEEKVGAKYATDLVFYSKRRGDGTQMLKQAIEWAFSRPRVVCFETAVSSGIGHRAAAVVYERAGLTLQGSFWRVDHPKMSEK